MKEETKILPSKRLVIIFALIAFWDQLKVWATSTADLVLQFLSEPSSQNFFRLFFSLAWYYLVPYLGGFMKCQSYHFYWQNSQEMNYLNTTIDDIYSN